MVGARVSGVVVVGRALARLDKNPANRPTYALVVPELEPEPEPDRCDDVLE